MTGLILDELGSDHPVEERHVVVGLPDVALEQAAATAMGVRYSTSMPSTDQWLPVAGDTSLEGRQLRAVLAEEQLVPFRQSEPPLAERLSEVLSRS